MNKIPKELLNTKYRKDLWKETQKIIKKLKVPISELYLLGSFVTKKKRPADVDFIVLAKTQENKNTRWSVDFVIAPNNKHGTRVLEDARLWMKQKYGKKFGVIKLK